MAKKVRELGLKGAIAWLESQGSLRVKQRDAEVVSWRSVSQIEVTEWLGFQTAKVKDEPWQADQSLRD
jgi:hypothetical protein